jgi:hypothetical protein
VGPALVFGGCLPSALEHIRRWQLHPRLGSRVDPKIVDAALPASQRWALEVLRSPDIPTDRAYAEADEAL